ncbi:MAG: hypothetical protein IPG04_04985 [Polyangiaceae bacterium]|nr:hypothetical protein [Polyangiaceae bacterium]
MTSAYGVEGVTEELVEALVASGARVKIAFDRDEAGGAGAERLAERLMGRGLEVYRVVFPEGDGRERIRGEGEARDGEPGSGAEAGALDGQERAPRTFERAKRRGGDATR